MRARILTHTIPTWKDYVEWCQLTGLDPFQLEGGNFRRNVRDDEQDEHIAALYRGGFSLGRSIAAFFRFWEDEINHDDLYRATQRWRKFFDS